MDVSIITINYNNSSLFKEFIHSLNLFFPSILKYELIIIDNASKKDDLDNLNKIISGFDTNIILHHSPINLGFGAGNMLGYQFSKGKYLAFINNDVIFTEDCFSPLINFLEMNPQVGVCTPQQYNINNEATSCFDYFHGIKKELFGRSFVEIFMNKSSVKRKDFPYKSNIKVDFIQGCFMLFDKKKFDLIGGFDTNLFLYFEEMDICFRLKQKGFSSYVLPSSSFKHLHGASTNKSFLISKELLISKLYIFRKNYSFFKFKILQFILIVKWFFKSILKFQNFRVLSIIIGGGHLKHSLKQVQVINKS